MKTLREMTAAALLAGVLTVSASAGEIYGGYAPPPPPPPDSTPTAGGAAEEAGETEDLNLDTLAALLSGLLTVL